MQSGLLDCLADRMVLSSKEDMALLKQYDYDMLDKILGDDRRQAKLGNNTYVAEPTEGDDDGRLEVILHTTTIATLWPDGDVMVNSGGYTTHTTKDRLNRFLPPGFTLFSDAGTWFVQKPTGEKVLFRNQMVFNGREDT